MYGLNIDRRMLDKTWHVALTEVFLDNCYASFIAILINRHNNTAVNCHVSYYSTYN